jgi:putative oxidoreductase
MNRLSPILQEVAVLVLRLWVGLALFFAHGKGKLEDPSDFVHGDFIQEHFPLPTILGWAAVLAESIGALLLAAGLMTRLCAFGIVGTMTGAAFVAHADDPFGHKEKALMYAFIALFFLLYGGGRWSVDRAITHYRRPPETSDV